MIVGGGQKPFGRIRVSNRHDACVIVKSQPFIIKVFIMTVVIVTTVVMSQHGLQCLFELCQIFKNIFTLKDIKNIDTLLTNG